MATVVPHDIKPDGTGHYASLALWEAAQQRNLVAGDQIARAVCYPGEDTSKLTISGWTTDQTRRIEIVAADPTAHGGVWSTDAYRLVVSGYNGVIQVGTNTRMDLLLQGLQVRNNGDLNNTTTGALYFQPASVSTTLEIDRCVFVSVDAMARTIWHRGDLSSTHFTVIRNSVIAGTGRSAEVNTGLTGESEILNTTFIGPTGIVHSKNGTDTYGKSTIKNCIAASFSYGWLGWTYDHSNNLTYNADADDFGGSGHIVNTTPTYENAAVHDFRLAAADVSGAKDGGTDLSAYGITADIAGTARPQGTGWDIGAFELPVAAENQAPTFELTYPYDGFIMTEGDNVVATATAIDPEDGDISANLVWTLLTGSVGVIGTGASQSLAGLPVGSNFISVDVYDSGGLHAGGFFTVTVEAADEPAIEAVGGGTLPALAAAASAGLTVAATGVATLPALQGTAATALDVEAAGAGVLPALTGQGAATVALEASGAATLPPLAGAGEASLAEVLQAEGAAVLPALLGTGTAGVQASVAGAGLLPALEGAGAAAVSVSITVAATLPALQGSGAIGGLPTTYAVGTVLLPALQGAGEAEALLAALAAATLPALTGSGGAVSLLDAVASGLLPALQVTGGVVLEVQGVAVGLLPALEGGGVVFLDILLRPLQVIEMETTIARRLEVPTTLARRLEAETTI